MKNIAIAVHGYFMNIMMAGMARRARSVMGGALSRLICKLTTMPSMTITDMRAIGISLELLFIRDVSLCRVVFLFPGRAQGGCLKGTFTAGV